MLLFTWWYHSTQSQFVLVHVPLQLSLAVHFFWLAVTPANWSGQLFSGCCHHTHLAFLHSLTNVDCVQLELPEKIWFIKYMKVKVVKTKYFHSYFKIIFLSFSTCCKQVWPLRSISPLSEHMKNFFNPNSIFGFFSFCFTIIFAIICKWKFEMKK